MVAQPLACSLLRVPQSLRAGQDHSGRDPERDFRRLHAHLDVGAVWDRHARTRSVGFPAERFLVGRAATLALLSLALIACLPKKSASLHVNPALEALVPSDTVVVLGVNLASIGTTPIYQKLITRVPVPQLDRFIEETGLDPRKDLSELLLCSNGKSPLLLIRGKFRIADLDARFKSKGVAPSNYKGHGLFGDDRAAITFLDDSTAAAGSPIALHSLIDQAASKG